MLARYATAITSGSLITVTLLWAMQTLIGLQPGAESEKRDRHDLDWVYVKKPFDPIRPDEPEFDVEDLTKVLPTPTASVPGSGNPGIPIAVPTQGPGTVKTGPVTLGVPDNPLITIVRVQPYYPAVAEQKGLTGWVDVRFDDTANGLVTNVVVTGYSHSIFERSAVKAAERFRYKAPVVDGVAQAVSGIEYRFRFDMET